MAAAGAEGDAAQALGARGDAAERGLELVGQELVPASQALALRTPDGLEKGRGSDAAKGSRSPRAATEPVSQGQKSKEGSVRGQKGTPKEIEPEKRQEMATPSGQPVSLGPHSFVTPEGQVQSMLPLFSPEQTVKLHEIHQMPFASPAASWNGPAVGEHGHGGAERQAVPGWFTGLLQSVGSQQGEHEARQRDYMWRMQVEHGIEHLGVQLRAAQHENQRLRQERQELLEALEKKGSSRFTTPDDKAANMLKKEEGAESRQERPSKEEGAGARQGTPSKEEGAEARQDRSSQEDGAEARQEQSESDSSSEEPQRASRPKESVDKQSMRIMLKLMEGMQELQKQIVISKEEGKGDEIEVVRYVADLPKLAEWNPETAPIDFGDWVICLHPHMADLSSTSEMWWDLTLSTARTWYDHHMKLSPIERLTSTPRPTPELQQKKWSRLERRASSLLLNALPQTMKEEVIAAKSITALGILSRAMLQFQPGGLTERSAILTALEAPMEAATVGSAIQQLRRWMRWKRRALEVGVSIPDSSILMKGLGRLVRKIVSSYPDLNFRLSLVKSSLLVETVPTLETVTQYSEHLLAELEQMGQQAKRKEVMAESQPKVKKFEEASGSKPEERTRPKGKPQEEFEGRRKPCRFYLTDSGCRRGRGCPFGHQLDGERRCWTCGGKDHMATACPTTEESKPKAAKFGSKTPEKDVKSATTSPEKSEEQSEATGNGGEETMKSLLDEASRMLKSMNEGDVKEKRQKGEDAQERILGLQKQLDELKKASMRPFRISKLCPMVNKGLLDSGATHPLRAKRKGERLHHLPKVKVTLAGDKEIYMALTPTGVIVGEEGTEPIVPMGLLTAVLGCEISWKPEGLQVVHPVLGKLEVVVEAGCPMVSQSTAMKLIEEIEAKAVKVVKSLKTGEDSEEAWLRRLVDEHPALQGIPEEVREAWWRSLQRTSYRWETEEEGNFGGRRV
jgi:chemotaxis protein histidine kinase CheA